MAEERGDLAARVARIEARDEIRELIARYAHGLDLPDRDIFMSVWAEDAVYKVDEPFGETVGIEAIGAAWDSFHIFFPYQYHHTMNVVIDGPHGGKASATSFVLVTGADREGTAWVASCTYFDDFEHIGGKWLFKRRYDKINYMTPWLKPYDGLTKKDRIFVDPGYFDRLLKLGEEYSGT